MLIPKLLFCSVFTELFLQNRIETLYITNTNLEKSSLALSIRVGKFQDKIPGISRLLEHMILKGNSKESKRNEFIDFLTKHGGSISSKTYNEIMVFSFEIDSEYLEEALEKFSQLIKNPTFDDELFKIEITRIESKFMLDLSNDSSRFEKFKRMCTKKYNQFGAGNLKTLDIDKIKEELKSLYQKYFIALNLKLIVYHNNDNLMKQVHTYFGDISYNHYQVKQPAKLKNENNSAVQTIESNEITTKKIETDPARFFIGDSEIDFIDVEDNNTNPIETEKLQDKNQFMSCIDGCVIYQSLYIHESVYKKDLFADNLYGRILHFQSLSEIKELVILIQMPQKQKTYADGTVNFIKNLIVDKNACSLNDILKKRDLAYKLKLTDELSFDFTILKIQLSLTDKGFSNIKEILILFYNFIDKLQFEESEFFRLRNNQRKKFGSMQIESPIEFSHELATNLQYYSIYDVLDHDFLFNHYDENNIRAVLNIIKNVNNWICIVLSDSIEEQYKSIYNKDVSRSDINDTIVKFSIPIDKTDVIFRENIYDFGYAIGELINIVPMINQFNEQIHEYDLRYIYNSNIKTPKSFISITFTNNSEKEKIASSFLYLNLVKETLIRDEINLIKQYNVEIEINLTPYGPEFIISGFDDFVDKLFKKFTEIFKNPSMDYFEAIKSKLIFELKQTEFEPIFEQIIKLFEQKSVKNFVSNDYIIDSLLKITIENISFFKEFNLKFFVYSVLGFDYFKNIAKDFSAQYPTQAQFDLEYDSLSKFELNTNDMYNNGTMVFYEVGEYFDAKNLAISLLQKQICQQLLIEETINNEKNLTGIFANEINIYEKNYLYFSIVSDIKCEIQEKKIEDFVELYEKKIVGFTAENFDLLKKSAISIFSINIDNLSEYFDFYKNLYFAKINDVNFIENVHQAILALKIEDLKIEGKKVVGYGRKRN
ncbi:metalloprotease [Gurleya vavrai]